jgi:hypothetical protein
MSWRARARHVSRGSMVEAARYTDTRGRANHPESKKGTKGRTWIVEESNPIAEESNNRTTSLAAHLTFTDSIAGSFPGSRVCEPLPAHSQAARQA